MEGVFVYMLKCNDGSYYVGTTRNTLEFRLAEHNTGRYDGYTARRRPVRLVWQQHFDEVVDAIAMERRLKGWGRAKKEALIKGDFERISLLAKRPSRRPSASSG